MFWWYSITAVKNTFARSRSHTEEERRGRKFMRNESSLIPQAALLTKIYSIYIRSCSLIVRVRVVLKRTVVLSVTVTDVSVTDAYILYVGDKISSEFQINKSSATSRSTRHTSKQLSGAAKE